MDQSFLGMEEGLKIYRGGLGGVALEVRYPPQGGGLPALRYKGGMAPIGRTKKGML